MRPSASVKLRSALPSGSAFGGAGVLPVVLPPSGLASVLGLGSRPALRRGGGPGLGFQVGLGLADLLQPLLHVGHPIRQWSRCSLYPPPDRRPPPPRLTQTARVPGFLQGRANRPRASIWADRCDAGVSFAVSF